MSNIREVEKIRKMGKTIKILHNSRRNVLKRLVKEMYVPNLRKINM